MSLGTPIAWNKAQIGSEILWIGWLFNLNLYNVQVVPDKVDRLQAMIIEILSAKTVRRKLLGKSFGHAHVVHNHRKILETTSCTNIQRFVLPTSHVVLNPGLILVSLYRYLGHLCHGCEIASPLCASIGGKVVETEQVLWFSEQVSMTEVRHWKPELKKDAQKYISAFEVLAQLALLMAASSRLLCDQMELCILSSSDNTSAESSINRQLSTKEPTSNIPEVDFTMGLSTPYVAQHFSYCRA